MKKRLIKVLKLSVRLALVAGLAGGGWYAYTQYLPEEEDQSLGALPTALAEVRDVTASVQATGVLQPITIVEIKSKASGEILQMPVEVGDLVEAGDLIAQIDTDILDQEMKQVKADYDSAVVRLEIADSQYERAKALHAQDLVSSDQLESNQQTYINAQAQMLRNEASMTLAQERLVDATVRAPARGTIIAKTVEEGQIIASSTNNVSGGTTLVQMADLSRLQVRTLVDEVDIGQVRGGLSVESKVEAFPLARFGGEVIKIEPQAQIQQSVTTFPVLSRIDNTDGKLLPGMNADVSIIVHRKPSVLVIPNEAVRSVDDAGLVKQMLGLVAEDGAFEGSGGGEGRGGGNAGTRRGATAAGRGGQPEMGEFRNSQSPSDIDPFGIAGRREDAVVFVYNELGAIDTRNIVVGARDWEYTEVLEGLASGDQVVVLPSTSLLQSQERFRDWARGSGGIPGIGGGGGRGRGR